MDHINIIIELQQELGVINELTCSELRKIIMKANIHARITQLTKVLYDIYFKF